MRYLSVLIGALVLANATPARAQWVSPSANEAIVGAPSTIDSSLSPAERARVEAVIDRYRTWFGLVGVNVAIVSGDTPVYRGAFGFANLELGVPNRFDTRFQLSSTAKVLSSLTLMKLVEDGVIDLDAPVKTYVPEAPPAWDEVTVRHLMQQLSGLPNIFDCPETNVPEILACLAAKPVQRPPGQQFDYVQTNAFLTLIIAERVTGKTWPQVVQDNLLRLASMADTVYSGQFREVLPRRATSYYPHEGGGIELRDYAFAPWNFGGAGPNSTLDDMIRLDLALRQGRLLKPETVEAMWAAPTMPNGRPANYALYWDVQRHPGGVSSYGHAGGFLTTFRVFPASRLTVIVLANGSYARFDPDDLAVELAGIVQPDLILPTQGLANAMRDALHANGLAAAAAVYDQGRGDLRMENAVNTLGYELLAVGRTADAVGILTLNTRDNPTSANAFDSLGEAQMKAGNLPQAKASYEEALRLDPASTSAPAQLAAINAQLAGTPTP